MGAVRDKVTGKTKIACWKEYETIRNDLIERDLYPQFPGHKRDAYRRMERDPQTDEWVLWYRFHT